MSKCTKLVRNDSASVVGYVVHDRACDSLYPSIFSTESNADEAQSHSDLLHATCTCGRESAPCWISKCPGEWMTTMCCVCMVITGPLAFLENLGRRESQESRDEIAVWLKAQSRCCPHHLDEPLVEGHCLLCAARQAEYEIFLESFKKEGPFRSPGVPGHGSVEKSLERMADAAELSALQAVHDTGKFGGKTEDMIDEVSARLIARIATRNGVKGG